MGLDTPCVWDDVRIRIRPQHANPGVTRIVAERSCQSQGLSLRACRIELGIGDQVAAAALELAEELLRAGVGDRRLVDLVPRLLLNLRIPALSLWVLVV